jgi:hypothetical protein
MVLLQDSALPRYTTAMSADTTNCAAMLLSARDRARRARDLRLSPAERLAAMRRLLAQARTILEGHAAGRAHFWRRNFAARALGRRTAVAADDT